VVGVEERGVLFEHGDSGRGRSGVEFFVEHPEVRSLQLCLCPPPSRLNTPRRLRACVCERAPACGVCVCGGGTGQEGGDVTAYLACSGDWLRLDATCQRHPPIHTRRVTQLCVRGTVCLVYHRASAPVHARETTRDTTSECMCVSLYVRVHVRESEKNADAETETKADAETETKADAETETKIWIGSL